MGDPLPDSSFLHLSPPFVHTLKQHFPVLPPVMRCFGLIRNIDWVLTHAENVCDHVLLVSPPRQATSRLPPLPPLFLLLMQSLSYLSRMQSQCPSSALS